MLNWTCPNCGQKEGFCECNTEDLLHVFTICWNEEVILQDFINFYRSRIPNCKITVYNNMSTDKTVDIAYKNNCEVISFDTGGKMDESTLMNIRNQCWKNSTSKWIIVADSDEWVDISEKMLEESTWEIAKCNGYEMFGTEKDKAEDLLYGVESVGYCKPIIFKKDAIKETNFAAGSHKASPESEYRHSIIWAENPPNLYHTKWRSWSNGIGKAHDITPRRSEEDKKKGWNFHYSLNDLIHKDYYENGMKNRRKIR